MSANLYAVFIKSCSTHTVGAPTQLWNGSSQIDAINIFFFN